eukprot:snap_masked-scaffold_102-processed-gene-0.14-mRNA-1 protein AED:1.00 eAED:1.00 QI:0/0/0/0/1/1/2/0/132
MEFNLAEKKDADKLAVSNVNSREHREARGLEQSSTKMSHLTPIEVTLRIEYQILRIDSYQQPSEEIYSLELKVEALRKARIAENRSNPIWVAIYLHFPNGWQPQSTGIILLWYRRMIGRMKIFLTILEGSKI